MDEESRQLIREQRRKERRAAKALTREQRVADAKVREPAQFAEQVARSAAPSDSVSGDAPDRGSALAFGGPDQPMLFVGHHKCASSLAASYVREFCALNNLS